MKKFSLFVFVIVVFFLGLKTSLAFTAPSKPNSFVNDYAGILNASEKVNLENKISNFEKQTSNEIAVVIIPSLDGDVIENVAQDIFTKWGVGKADKDNGVLLLISIEEHKIRIQTGYGVEGSLTDLTTSYIQSDVMTPNFKQGNYYIGINGAVDKMIESLGGNNIIPENYSTSKKSNINFNFVLFLFIVFLQFSIKIMSRSKSWWLGGVLGLVPGAVIVWFFEIHNTIAIALLLGIPAFLGLLLDYSVSRKSDAQEYHKKTGRFPWWYFGPWGGGGMGGFGGGSFGGGFGGFGGGRSGGGGSSGSW